MKRLMLAVLAVAAFAAVSGMGVNYAVNGGCGVALAAEELDAKGLVESVDAEKGALVIKLNGSDETLAIEAGSDELKGLEKGDKVKVQYTAGDKNVATRIRKLGPILPPTGC